MKYPASERLEIIRLVEGSHLPVNRTLEKLGVSRPTFYRWCDLYQRFGEDGLEDRRSGPGRVWNRIPDEVRGQLIDLALEQPGLSPRPDHPHETGGHQTPHLRTTPLAARQTRCLNTNTR